MSKSPEICEACGKSLKVVRDCHRVICPLSEPTPALTPSKSQERCPYCSDNKNTGLPGGACENCMNTGLKYPELSAPPYTVRGDEP